MTFILSTQTSVIPLTLSWTVCTLPQRLPLVPDSPEYINKCDGMRW